MSGPSLPPGIGFDLAVPPTWIELDVDPATRESSLAALVAAQVRDVPDLRPHRTAIARLLGEQAREAWEAGAAYCASMVEPTEDGPITASVVALVVPAPLGVSDDALVDALVAPLSPRPRTETDERWREVRVVDVPGAGSAARTAGVEDVDLPDGGTTRMVLLRTLVPLGAQRVLALTCASPVLPLVEELLDLFDAVSGTLRIVNESERRAG